MADPPPLLPDPVQIVQALQAAQQRIEQLEQHLQLQQQQPPPPPPPPGEALAGLPRPVFSRTPEGLPPFVRLLVPFVAQYPEHRRLAQAYASIPAADLPFITGDTVDEVVASLTRAYTHPTRIEQLAQTLLPPTPLMVSLSAQSVSAFKTAYEQLVLLGGDAFQLPVSWVRLLLLLQLSEGVRATVRERTAEVADLPDLWTKLHTLAGLSSQGPNDMQVDAAAANTATADRPVCNAYKQGHCDDKECRRRHPFHKDKCLACGRTTHRAADCPKRRPAAPPRHQGGGTAPQ